MGDFGCLQFEIQQSFECFFVITSFLSFLQLSDELSGVSSISFSLSMAISSNFSILSEDVVVVCGASDVELSLAAVVVWNGTLVVSSFF